LLAERKKGELKDFEGVVEKLRKLQSLSEKLKSQPKLEKLVEFQGVVFNQHYHVYSVCRQPII
jgi:hypothetical protein